VCKYFDSYFNGSNIVIIMEYCENGDLGKYLKRQMNRPLNETKIWKFFIEMSLGLNYLHTHKILHRDIKTINMFLGKEDKIKIGDLGVAKLLNQTANMAHTVVGTPYYLSPELCEEKPYNHKSDVWSLGCVLYELCTFKHPFEATNQGALILKIVRGKFESIPSHYSSDLKELTELLLKKDQKKRPSLNDILKLESV
jgi:NIMA (never in mitosis gene a)-related kinase